jgi:hypothetical protein
MTGCAWVNLGSAAVQTREMLVQTGRADVLFHGAEMFFRPADVYFRENELLFRSTDVFFQGAEDLFRCTDVLFRAADV